MKSNDQTKQYSSNHHHFQNHHQSSHPAYQFGELEKLNHQQQRKSTDYEAAAQSDPCCANGAGGKLARMIAAHRSLVIWALAVIGAVALLTLATVAWAQRQHYQQICLTRDCVQEGRSSTCLE